jgi:ankyrin repeat protein
MNMAWRLAALLVAAGSVTPGCLGRPDEGTIALSYEEHSGDCGTCPAFELTFRSGGNVEFHGLGGCALPGTHHYTIPEAEWKALVELVRSSDFFDIPRLGGTAVEGARIITYRDARRIHEVIDEGRDDSQLNAIEKAMRTAGHVGPWIAPTPKLYRKALAERWDVNSRNEDGWTALQCAVVKNRDDAVRVLLQAGATISPETFKSTVFSNMDEGATILKILDHAAPLDVHSQMAADLLVTAAERNLEAVRYLLERGVPVDARTGTRAMFIVQNQKNPLPGLRLLLERGADPNARGAGGRTALHAAAVGDQSGLIAELAKAGAIVDAVDDEGFTPLMRAVAECHYWNVKPLLDVGADPRPALAAFPTEERQWSSGIEPKCRETQKALTTP